jgi:hypothetical protein
MRPEGCLSETLEPWLLVADGNGQVPVEVSGAA